MKITFDTWNQNPAMDKVTTTYEASSVHKGQQAAGAYALDISGTVTDNNAYGTQGRAIKDVMQSFDAQVDMSVQRDYMTVMSNILSTEDYNKMMEDGFDPSKIEPDQYVTIVDHIKAEMAKSGQVIAGYNDDLDSEQLKEALGDAGLAREVERALRGVNMPVNEENVNSIKESLDKAASVSSYDEASKKYMVENHMEPTVENMYRSSFSASGDGSKQSKGYYAQEMPGYFAKKADTIDWKAMQPQLEKAVAKMDLGEQTMEQSLDQAKWLMQRGIPVTQETMSALGRLDSVSVPLDAKTVIRAGVNALLEGKTASEGSLVSTQESIYEKAVRYTEEIDAITEDAVRETLAKGEELNLRNLYAAQMQIHAAASIVTQHSSGAQISASIEISFSQEKYVTASRQLAEVQLRMTIDANIKLLKSDYAIDTAPLAELVDMLKQQEEKISAQFFGEDHSEGISAKADLFTQTKNTLEELPFLPAAVIGRITYAKSVSLSVVHTEGMALRAQYKAAGESYETLMTAPRADMGDSIKKAFRNVDDILQDMGLEQTEDNKKAVRILGYNRMQITEESVRDVREVYLQVEDVIKSMTPQKTLSMIRDGVNPLTMELEELENYLNGLDHTPEEEMTKYSRFLYELEKNGQISDGEREAYIGVYRLFHQIEKSDGAVIGSLVAQGAELTLGNLLSAVRSRKAGRMDYSVDDSFGTVSETIEKGKSISNQIEKGVREAHAVYRDINVEALGQMPIHDDITLEQLKDAFGQAQTEVLSEEMAKDLLREYRQDQNKAAQVEEAVLDIMKQHDIPFTVENLLAVNAVLNEKGQALRNIKEAAKNLDRANDNELVQTELTDMEQEIIENFNDFDSAQEVLEKWEMRMKNTISDAISDLSYSGDKVKEMYMNYKQLSVMSTMRRNESYEIPMEINGEMTSINLTLMHDAEEKGTVSITMNTAYFGKAGAKFKVSANRIDSYFIADSEMGKEKLQAAGEKILASFKEMGMEVGDTRYVNAYAQGRKEWNMLTFSEQNVDNNNETVAAKQLYRIAKTFLKGMRDFT